MYSFFHRINFSIVIVLFSALIFRIFLASFGTLELDHGTFVAWGNSLATNGLKSFYSGWSDYLPGYLYILWVLGKINTIVPQAQTIMFKLPAIIADVLTGYLIYKVLRKTSDERTSYVGSILYLFNPAIFANSALWGQVDSLTSLFSIFAIYIFRTSYLLSAVSLAIGTLMKPQAAFIIPAIIYMFIVYKKNLFELAKYCSTGLIVFTLGFYPFNNQPIFFNFILERLTISSSQYPYGSVNAFSFWGLFGFWKPDVVTFWLGLLASIVLVTCFTLVILRKKFLNAEYLIAFLSLMITYLFMTRIHERHMLPVFAPLIVFAMTRPILFVVYGGLSLTYLANLRYAFVWITDNFKEIFNPLLIKFFIITNISLFIFAMVATFKKITFNFNLKVKNTVSKLNFQIRDISYQKTKVLMFCILIFSFISRIYGLGFIKEMYFDEIYHSFTAKLVLHGDPKAWEFWNPNPDGFAYEWTHPPLSKLGMALGMKVFGENSFGWRFPQALLGTLSVYLVFLLARFIFKDNLVGVLSATVFSLDGLQLVLSRMGMNDSYVLFFSLLSIYLFVKNNNFWSAVAFGLALSSKWSSIYTFPIIFISHFVFKKEIKISYLFFVFIPIVIYIASYGVMFATGHTWTNFIDTQKQMWWYHTGLVAEHPYTSPAWSWPILVRPIYLYNGEEFNNTVARIYAFGNPVVFWFGLFSIILSFYVAYKEKYKMLGFVLFSYLIFFLPWIMSPRIMFLYHYLPSIPFLAITSGFILRRFPKITIYYILLATVVFVYFYPHYTGFRIPEWLDSSYYWFSTWR